MCGVVGYVNLDGAPASDTIVKHMADLVAHRGPDDAGIFIEGGVAFGHRRLSIIDLSAAGHQPMHSADGRYTLNYNGEIYNYAELRRELAAKGQQFQSQSDTEVLLYALAHWGRDAIVRLNGMFSFAFYDRARQTVLLGRDRYGIKPLYLVRCKNSILFASEIKAFRAHPDFRSELDLEGLIEYFTFQNFFTSRTLFKNVTLLPAAHTLEIRPGTAGTAKPIRYWDFNFVADEKPRRDEEYTEELARLFERAVSRQLVGDRPVASYLSGGMDSGAITAVASRQMPEMLSFTIGFDRHSMSGLEIAMDERENAEWMSYLFGTRHYEMVLKAGDMERCLSKLVWHLEEPRVGQSYPNFYASHLASRFSKVVLAGSGGDELFGGYPWRYYRTIHSNTFESYVDKYYLYWHRLVDNSTLWKLFAGIKDQVGHIWTHDIFRDVFSDPPNKLTPEDCVNHSLYLEAKTFLHGLLVVEDKLSMAHGLETRLPFLDNDLVDFAMRLPVSQKLGRLDHLVALNENESAFQKKLVSTRDGKMLLRRLMRNYVPQEIADGVKQGFSAPDQSWFKGDSIDFVRDRLMSTNSPIYQWMDYKIATGLVEEHIRGEANRRLLIWSLLYFDEMCRTFF